MGQNGGKRPGAGRPKGISTKIIERQSHADKLLDKLGGDATWEWALNEAKKAKDFRTVADILKYWTDRAQGKAAQSMKLESNVKVSFGEFTGAVTASD